jgi:uncharacterized protein
VSGTAERPRSALLVLAKAPVPGLAKTRLSPPATPGQAAAIAAAALLDTLDAVLAVPGACPVVAHTGRLEHAVRRSELVNALDRTVQFSQRGTGLGERIAAAHAEVARRLPGLPVLQIGMDTPQAGPELLGAALAELHRPGGPDALLGPAADGGWWALGLRDPWRAALVAGVPTSRADTGARTLDALRGAGLRVAVLPELRDVDTVEDARSVAGHPDAGSRFAAEVTRVLRATAGAAR